MVSWNMAKIADIPKVGSRNRRAIKNKREMDERMMANTVFMINSLPKDGPSDSNFCSW